MAFFGKWVDRVGARIAGLTGAMLYGGGMVVGALGVYTHHLPLLYLGYGAIAGCGMGISYLPPVATLVKWFPDRRGLASGMAICGFGGGSLFIVTLKQKMLSSYFTAPEYVGNTANVITKQTNDGQVCAQISDDWKEVVFVSASELQNIGHSALNEGLYLINTGNTGVAATMATLGCGYLLICAMRYNIYHIFI